MNRRIWTERQADPDSTLRLSRDLGIYPITAGILARRGFVRTDEARQFLRPGSEDLIDPSRLPDIGRAIDRIRRAVRDREPVVIYGDYDVDGMTATALYYNWFLAQGSPVSYYIPHRLKEGYGLNHEAMRRLQDGGARLLITADCGSSSVEEVREARERGLDTIITDHHEVSPDPEEWPPAEAFINPKRADSDYPFQGLCTAGLAYKVIQALSDGTAGMESLDLVALGTLADLSPLVGENRYLVQEGLRQLGAERRVGIRALKAAAGLSGQEVGPGAVGFVLAPRINAAGRLADAREGVRLLTTSSAEEARGISERISALNQERQAMEELILNEVRGRIDRAADPSSLAAVVEASDRWHVGVVGIVASRVVERYMRPAVMIALDENGIGRGSARSIPGFNMHEALQKCSDLLLKYGGHRQAAGLTIREDRIAAFAERFSDHVMKAMGGEFPSTLWVDAAVELEDLKFPLIRELEGLRPHGIGNPEPVFIVREAIALGPRVVGRDHLKLKVRKRGALTFDAIGFRMGDRLQGLRDGQRLNLAFVPEVHVWQGREEAQLRIKDLQTLS